jgi:hypothetical protein
MPASSLLKITSVSNGFVMKAVLIISPASINISR